MRYVGLKSAGIFILSLGACAQVEGPPAQVSVVLSPSFTISESPLLFGTKSTSGLVTNNFCYFIHVTAPDLMDPSVEPKPDTCGHGPSGKGLVFGAYSFGKKALLSLNPGFGRRFDLLGFRVPDGTSLVCEDGRLDLRVESTESGSKVKVFYDDVEIGADPDSGVLPDYNTDLYIFSRSEPVDLTTGQQSVSLNPVAYVDRKIAGVAKSLPKRYSCNSGAPATLVFEPASLDFGMRNVLSYEWVTVRNTGSVPATLMEGSTPTLPVSFLSYALNDAYPGHTEDDACGAVLAANETCRLKFKFDPTALVAGAFRSGFTNISYYAGDAGDVTPLRVTGSKPAAGGLTLSRSFVDFGPNNGISKVNVALRNDSGAAISAIVLNAGVLTSPFSQIAHTCTSTLANGSTCLIQLQFDAAATGPGSTHTANYSINYSGGSPLTLPLSGSRPGTGITLSGSTIGFGTRTTDIEASVGLTNSSGAPISGISVSIPGTAFVQSSDNCGSTLPTGGTCTLIFRFKASSVASGTYTAIAIVTSSAGSATVTLSGTRP